MGPGSTVSPSYVVAWRWSSLLPWDVELRLHHGQHRRSLSVTEDYLQIHGHQGGWARDVMSAAHVEVGCGGGGQQRGGGGCGGGVNNVEVERVEEGSGVEVGPGGGGQRRGGGGDGEVG